MESQHKSQLKPIVLNLRHILEGRYDDTGIRQPSDLEERLAAFGVRRDREALPLEQLSHLSEEDQRTRKIVDAFIQSSVKSGLAREEAFQVYLQEASYTWANRLIALRCMEAQGLIDEIILQKENYGGRSLKHHRLSRQKPETCTGEDDGLYAVLFAEFAERAEELPLLFNPDEPVIALKPGVAALKKCIQLLSAPDEIFAAPDVLGWAYQYWNTEEKDRVFTKVRTVKGAKIEKADIIPVTQLYTEPYMVKFLVQNSLGALWMAMHPDSRLCESWKYYVRDADRAPVERKSLKRISFLDPCVGSGHFHLEAFDLLYAMYEEEGDLTTPAEICETILSHNLYGIDIDERAIQIAALALYMKAKEKAPDFSPKRINLVATNIHSGEEIRHLDSFLTKHPEDKPLEGTLRLIFDSLRHADELGTLLQIEEPVEKEFRILKARDDENRAGLPKQETLFPAMKKAEQQTLPLSITSYEEWKDGLLVRLNAHFQEEFSSADFSSRFFGETAGKGLSLFDFLSRRYDVVATNPPYMGSKNMGPVVKRYVEKHFASGKRDLYAAFILRCLELAKPETGRVAMVTQQSWMFLRSFADLRALDEEKLKKGSGFRGILRETSIETLAHLGEHAFHDSSAAGAFVVLFTLAKKAPSDGHRLTAFRLIGPKSPEEKDAHLRNGDRSAVSRPRHARFLSIPQSPVCYWLRERFFELLEGRTLGDVADVCQGLATANDPRFVRFTWEAPTGEWRLPVRSRRWVPFEKGGGYGKWFGHHFWVVDWAHSGGRIKSTPNPRVQNEQYYFREGRTYSYMARGSIGVRRVDLGTITCDLSAGVFERIQQPALSSILNSRIASYVIRSISAKIQLRESYVSRIPLPPHVPSSLANTESVCIVLKRHIIAHDPIERSFGCIPITGTSLAEHVEAVAAVLHTLEGLSEREVFKAYGIEGEDLQEVLDETGTPAGWFPLIKGYDALFPLTPALSLNGEGDWRQGLLPDDDGRLCLKPADLDALKSRLRALYEAGPGTKEENGEADTDGENGEEEENDQIALGARILSRRRAFWKNFPRSWKSTPSPSIGS